MSTDNQNNPTDMNPRRRGSVTQQALAGLFRSNSTSMGVNFQTSDPNRRRLSIATTGIGLAGTSPTTTSGAAFSSFRRGSISTNSDSIDENAIDEEESSRTAPVTPFTRRMSFGAPSMRPRNGNGSPGSNGNNPSAPSRASAPKPPAVLGRRGSVNPRSLPAGASPSQPPQDSTSPPPSIATSTSAMAAAALASSASASSSSAAAAAAAAVGRRPSIAPQASTLQNQRTLSDASPPPRSDQGFNWSEQLRSRAESSVTGQRPSFSFGASNMSTSPPRASLPVNSPHDRAKSVSDMPAPPAQAMKPKAPEPQRQKPDAFQERILKGDFYMD